jgi:hypothetical protein
VRPWAAADVCVTALRATAHVMLCAINCSERSNSKRASFDCELNNDRSTLLLLLYYYYYYYYYLQHLTSTLSRSLCSLLMLSTTSCSVALMSLGLRRCTYTVRESQQKGS